MGSKRNSALPGPNPLGKIRFFFAFPARSHLLSHHLGHSPTHFAKGPKRNRLERAHNNFR